MHACREVNGYNPYVEFQSGTLIPAQAAKFCSQDAQATQTSELTDLLPASHLFVPILPLVLLLLLPSSLLTCVSYSMTANTQLS